MAVKTRKRVSGVTKRADEVGRITMRVKLANQSDRNRAAAGDIPAAEVRHAELDAVDTGAMRLILPKKAVDALGLLPSGTTRVRCANHRTTTRDVVQNVWLECAGREGVFSAVVEPKRKDALIGAIVMEELDLIADCAKQVLRPRDPETTISEVE